MMRRQVPLSIKPNLWTRKWKKKNRKKDYQSSSAECEFNSKILFTNTAKPDLITIYIYKYILVLYITLDESFIQCECKDLKNS